MNLDKLKDKAQKLLKNQTFPFQTKPPYELKVETGIDVSKTRPYYVHVQILYGDSTFKKRMNAILKEEKYILVYDFKEENKGSFFDPKYEMTIQMHMMKQLISKADAIVMDFGIKLFTFGLVDGVFDIKENVIKASLLKNRKEYFKTEKEAKLFADKIKSVLEPFLSKYFNEYQQLLLKENQP